MECVSYCDKKYIFSFHRVSLFSFSRSFAPIGSGIGFWFGIISIPRYMNARDGTTTRQKKTATAATKWWFGIVHIYCETKNLLLGEFFSGFVKKVIVKWNICEQFVVVHRTKWFFSVRDFRSLWLVFCCLCCPFAAFFISDHANISSASKQMSDNGDDAVWIQGAQAHHKQQLLTTKLYIENIQFNEIKTTINNTDCDMAWLR